MKGLVFFHLIFFSIGPAFGNCGRLVNALLVYDSSKASASFDEFTFTQEEFCDGGKNELNANLEVQLIDKNKKILAAKNIYINPFSIVESLGKKNFGTIEKNFIHREQQYRNVKFSVTAPASQVAHYRIFSLLDKKLLGSGEVK